MKIFSLALIILLISSCCSQITHKINKKTDYYIRSHNISKYWSQKAETNKKYAGHFKVGKPYVIKRKKYFPKNVTSHREIGIASWYECDFRFQYCKTANQDIFHKDMLTAAHKTLPMPSLVKVTNLSNRKSIIVMINDRGPYKPNRIIDLSEKGAKLLGFFEKGLAKVKIEYLHNETKKLHKKLSLPAQENKYPTGEFANKKCGIKRYINTVNMKYKFIRTQDVNMSYKPHCLNVN